MKWENLRKWERLPYLSFVPSKDLGFRLIGERIHDLWRKTNDGSFQRTALSEKWILARCSRNRPRRRRDWPTLADWPTFSSCEAASLPRTFLRVSLSRASEAHLRRCSSPHHFCSFSVIRSHIVLENFIILANAFLIWFRQSHLYIPVRGSFSEI